MKSASARDQLRACAPTAARGGAAELHRIEHGRDALRVGRVVGVQRQRRADGAQRLRMPTMAYAASSAVTMLPRCTAPSVTRRRVDEHLVGVVPVQAVDVDERDLDDRERAVVRRLLAVGELVVGGERIAVEGGEASDGCRRRRGC